MLARIGWPASQARDQVLRPDAGEQKRFTAGQEIFKNSAKAATVPMVASNRAQREYRGSPTVSGPAGVPIRVLLHGKEGPVGLMPAHGETLNDEELAAVLTYSVARGDRRAPRSMRAPFNNQSCDFE